MREDQERWLEALKARQEEAIRQLVREFGEPLRRYCSAMVRSPADGEDLAQEALVRFVGAVDAFRGEASVKTYLFRIAHNLALNHLASSAVVHEELPGEIREGPSPAASPLHAAQSQEEGRMLREALARLPPQQRAVVALRTWQDLSFKEIGAVMGLAEGTAKAHYFFALRNLRRQLEPGDEP